MRKLESPVNVHIDHVAAVLDLNYSPTGEEFVSGGFDKTVRIFPRNRGKSRLVIILMRYVLPLACQSVLPVCLSVCMRAFVRVRTMCARACVCACVRACVCVGGWLRLGWGAG